MTSLSVLKFPTAEDAPGVESTLLYLQAQNSIEILDAAILVWVPGTKRPKTQRLQSLVGKDASTSTFWEMLFGLIFPVTPNDWTGVKTAGGSYIKLADYGIGDEFIKQVAEKVTEGSSALFLLTRRCVMEKMVDGLQGRTFEIVFINLSKAQEDELRYTYGDV
jgi:uncharacterized membrane protein